MLHTIQGSVEIFLSRRLDLDINICKFIADVQRNIFSSLVFKSETWCLGDNFFAHYMIFIQYYLIIHPMITFFEYFYWVHYYGDAKLFKVILQLNL